MWAMALLAAIACNNGDARRLDSTSGLTATIGVEPFRSVAPNPAGWVSGVFADSLSTHLSRLRGLRVIRDHQEPADFILRGDVTVRDARLVMSVRLSRPGEPSATWTSTFWRSNWNGSNLVQDVAAAVAEALYADVARRAITERKSR